MRTKLSFLRSRGSLPEPAQPAADVSAADAPAIVADESPEHETPRVASETAAPPRPEPARNAARMIEGGRTFERKLRGVVAAAGWRRPAAIAAALVATGGLGYAAGQGLHRGGESRQVAALRLTEAAATMRQSHEEMIRLGGELKAMKVAVEALRGERDRSRGELLGKQAQLAEKVDRTNQDTVSRIGKVAEQLERIERTQRDPARLQSVIERLDRMEKQALAVALAPPAAAPVPVASLTLTPPAKPAGMASAVPDVTQTGSLGDAKTPKPEKAEADPRKTQLDGYALRDIDDGYALIEMKNGRFVEVAAGGFLPGVGRIEAIERRGRQWVVLTPKGFIGERGAMDR